MHKPRVLTCFVTLPCLTHLVRPQDPSVLGQCSTFDSALCVRLMVQPLPQQQVFSPNCNCLTPFSWSAPPDPQPEITISARIAHFDGGE
ncbi:hypothetical protein BDZ91DRAFT_738780 [Kalaharituber pfeilii]|nr:hypothetical protein BDZ91DRAFT_738780 [Kalaharituber pfeilii]